MTESGELLVVDLDGFAYGLDAALVRETLWLPELSPADGMAPEVVGLFNLRGEILPVVDAGLCLGRPAHRCRASDQVVVLATAGPPVALLVSEVRDLARLPSAPSWSIPLRRRRRQARCWRGACSWGTT